MDLTNPQLILGLMRYRKIITLFYIGRWENLMAACTMCSVQSVCVLNLLFVLFISLTRTRIEFVYAYAFMQDYVKVKGH